MTLEESVKIFAHEKRDYYKQWIFDEPIFISKTHIDELTHLQKIMYQLIYRFVTNYEQYKSLMPIDANTEKIIRIFNELEYVPGTYRTDFVYDHKLQPKLIEITCRFAFNGLFLSALMNFEAENQRQKLYPTTKSHDVYSRIFNELNKYFSHADKVFILKGGDIRNESKIFEEIIERMNKKVVSMHYSEITTRQDELEGHTIISELALEEIASLPLSTIAYLSKQTLLNDFRTVFLIHDKRFFSVIGDEQFLRDSLSDSDYDFFMRYYIPSFNYSKSCKSWQDARVNKDKWIIKHSTLGKSQQIYAGIVTSDEEWEQIFAEELNEKFVLQEWISPSKMKGTVNGVSHDDYVTGTLLFFNQNFYGFGDFRTSSYPITNKVDHRKMTYLVVSDNDETIMNNEFINYVG
jgi:hypothetical protein